MWSSPWGSLQRVHSVSEPPAVNGQQAVIFCIDALRGLDKTGVFQPMLDREPDGIIPRLLNSRRILLEGKLFLGHSGKLQCRDQPEQELWRWGGLGRDPVTHRAQLGAAVRTASWSRTI